MYSVSSEVAVGRTPFSVSVFSEVAVGRTPFSVSVYVVHYVHVHAHGC